MVLGYYVFEAFMLGYGWDVALAGVPANIFQGITGVAAAALLTQLLPKGMRGRGDEYDEEDEEE